MGAIAGIWNLDGRLVEDDLTHLGAPLASGRYARQTRWTEGSVALICSSLTAGGDPSAAPPPLVHRSGAVVAFDGRLDNRDELIEVLGGGAPELSTDPPDSTLVLAAYEAFGDAFPERLLGDFALALFDSTRRQLLLARDAVGVRPLHFWRSPQRVLFASTIKSLLAYPAVAVRPNEAVVARYLCHQLAHDDLWATCFDGISTLPPAHLAIVTPQRFITRQYWDFDPRRQVRLHGMGEYAEAFRHYFDQSVARQLRSAHPVAISLSGGLDSSSVYGAAETIRCSDRHRHPPVIALSYIYEDASLADETAYLRDIERKFGTTVQRLPAAPPGGDLLDRVREQLWQVETPLLSEHWRSFARLLDHAHGQGARVVLTGQSGDQVLLTEAYLVDLVRRFRWYRAWRDLREIPRWFTDAEPGVFTRDFVRNVVKFCAPALVDAYRWLRVTAVHASPLPGWYTTSFRTHAEWSAGRAATGRRWATAYATWMYAYLRSPTAAVINDWYAKVAEMHGLEQRAPFLDRDLLAFVLSIPGDMQTSKGVPKALLRDAMRGVLPDSIAGRRWKGDYTQKSNEGVTRLVPWLLEALRSDALVLEFGYVDRARAIEALHHLRLIRSEPFDAFPVWRLIGLELWLQVFFGDRTERDRQYGVALKRA